MESYTDLVEHLNKQEKEKQEKEKQEKNESFNNKSRRVYKCKCFY